MSNAPMTDTSAERAERMKESAETLRRHISEVRTRGHIVYASDLAFLDLLDDAIARSESEKRLRRMLRTIMRLADDRAERVTSEQWTWRYINHSISDFLNDGERESG